MASLDTLVEKKRLARQIPEGVATRGELDLIDEICTEDVADHSPLGEITGRDALKAQIRSIRNAFADFSATVEDSVAEGDTVAMRVTLRGRHVGEFMGIDATDTEVEVDNMVFTRIEDDRIAERWVQPDLLGLMQQIGAVERPEP
ncbi:ester cyclase [Halomicroarcula sp. GCM10025709]|uniref:ester cyclase n=1 Tax=Haloarcula TaxID=2237 RepID=UPI0024C3DC87|nr:ester cyclase [Halomicroarcula sp. YJ-61-S]